MTTAEYFLAFLFCANGLFNFGYMRRIQELERKMNLALTQLGIDPNVRIAPSSQVMSLAADPRKRIEAIKAYREQTGAGLKEAVEVVDKLAASTKQRHITIGSRLRTASMIFSQPFRLAIGSRRLVPSL